MVLPTSSTTTVKNGYKTNTLDGVLTSSLADMVNVSRVVYVHLISHQNDWGLSTLVPSTTSIYVPPGSGEPILGTIYSVHSPRTTC